MSKKVGTVELVIFKVKNNLSEEEVIGAANAVNPVLESYAGFISRKLAVSKDGVWSDIVYWSDLKSAEYAGQEVMKNETCQAYFGMIDEKSMNFMHLKPVLLK